MNKNDISPDRCCMCGNINKDGGKMCSKCAQLCSSEKELRKKVYERKHKKNRKDKSKFWE